MMQRWMWVVLALALVVGAGDTAFAQRPAGDEGLLLADGFSGAWKKAGPLKVFTSADLYGYIDGGAEAFLEIGFEQLTVQKYRDGANELTAELYRMSDPTAARGIYVARCGKETPDPALRERHTASRHQILLQRHRYYLVLNNTAGGAANAPILATAARAMVGKMPADAQVPALALLPQAGLVPGSARLFRGPVGLQAVYTLGDGDILQLGGKITAVSGDYKDAAAGATTLIVAEYATPGAAAAAFKHLKANLDSYLKATSSSDARLAFQDYEKKFGAVTLSGRRLEVRLHLAKAPSSWLAPLALTTYAQAVTATTGGGGRGPRRGIRAGVPRVGLTADRPGVGSSTQVDSGSRVFGLACWRPVLEPLRRWPRPFVRALHLRPRGCSRTIPIQHPIDSPDPSVERRLRRRSEST